MITNYLDKLIQKLTELKVDDRPEFIESQAKRIVKSSWNTMFYTKGVDKLNETINGCSSEYCESITLPDRSNWFKTNFMYAYLAVCVVNGIDEMEV